MLNMFSTKFGITKMSPATIAEGKDKTYLSVPKLAFGSYAMSYIKTSNDTKNRSIPSISLRASNNAGSCYFMSLYTGKRLQSYHWKEFPICEEVIERVKQLAIKENQTLLIDNHPIF